MAESDKAEAQGTEQPAESADNPFGNQSATQQMFQGFEQAKSQTSQGQNAPEMGMNGEDM